MYVHDQPHERLATCGWGTGRGQRDYWPRSDWTSVSNDAWITVTGGSSGTGNGSVNYSVAANPGGARTGSITIATQPFAVNQAAAMRTLTVGRTGTGNGTITGSGINCGADCTEVYTHGTAVPLTASPAPGSVFVNWSGDCTGTQNPFTVDDGHREDVRCEVRSPLGHHRHALHERPERPQFVANGPIRYTITLSNIGTATQGDNAGHELVDVLPGDLTDVSAAASSGVTSSAGNTVAWDGSIPAGGSVTITIDATV